MGTLDYHLKQLRVYLARWLSTATWKELEPRFASLGLTWRPELAERLGKDKYISTSLNQESPTTLRRAAHSTLQDSPSFLTHQIQNELWWIESNGSQRITEVTRRTLIEELPTQISGNLPVEAFKAHIGLVTLESGFNDALSTLFGDLPSSTRSGTTHDLVEWGFYSWPDRRLFIALEAIVHPTANKHTQQEELAQTISRIIQQDGYTLQSGEPISGHPTYQIHELTQGVQGKPKNIIFASNGRKPLLGFSDAINNDIVVLEHESSCLIYSEPLGSDSLTWATLAQWWARENKLATKEEGAKRLSARLIESIKSSPGQLLLYKTYLKTFRPLLDEMLPALIPEVYHVYDPKTAKERSGRPIFNNQRMDFLILLSHSKRIVIEIDGMQHYSFKNGQANPCAYTNTLQGDRELRLRGYEVYRFSHHEIMAHNGPQTIISFFDRLFRLHNLLV
ncbi:hypothetical protein [Myxococcus sp. Y35]|uniref:AbiJ-related protein n=1 Tax=Pseudomyxococcus flavus TaxID=3115648 RepID=UPI003CEF3E78